MLAVRPSQAVQAARFAMLGAAAELTVSRLLLRRLGPAAAEPYQKGRAGAMMRASEVLTAAGLAGAGLASTGLAGKGRPAAALSGAALMVASALTRFGVFEAGRAGARDPKYTVGPQRQRLRERRETGSAEIGVSGAAAKAGHRSGAAARGQGLSGLGGGLAGRHRSTTTKATTAVLTAGDASVGWGWTTSAPARAPAATTTSATGGHFR